MVIIRLSRIGKKNHATFRIVVADHARAVKGKAIEILGSYDPHRKVVQVHAESAKAWIAKGARMSPTIHNMFVDQKIIDAKKVTAWKPPARRRSPEATEGGPKKETVAAPTETPATKPAAEAPAAEAPAPAA